MTAIAATLQALIDESEALPLLPAANAGQLSEYLEVSGRWVSAVDTHLPLITVLASHPYHRSAPDQYLWLRHIAFYLLTGTRNRVNHHTLQQGTAALLTYYRLRQATETLSRQRLANVIKQLRRFSQFYWSNCVLPPSTAKCRYEDCFETVWLWMRWVQRSPTVKFAQMLQKLTLALPFSGQQHLAALVEYPGTLPEGSYVKHQHQTAVVVSQIADSVLVHFTESQHFKWLKKKPFELPDKPFFTVEQWLVLAEELSEQPQQDGEVFSLGDHGWALPPSYPTGRPPASLQALLSALNNPDIALSKVVELVNAEPRFSHFLTDAASKDNRLQLAVQNVKQSIMTYGLGRVGNMLVQYALFQRLIQHEFPLLPWFSRLAQIAITISSELATASRTITPQSASLITTVAVSPLFTLPDLKGHTQIINSNQRLFDITSLTASNSTAVQGKIRQRLISLAAAWQQEKAQGHLIACCGKLPGDVPNHLRLSHCITGLSLIWAREWLLGQTPCEQTHLFVNQTQRSFPSLLTLKDEVRPAVSPLLNCPLI